jgi:hypothetical protein
VNSYFVACTSHQMASDGVSLNQGHNFRRIFSHFSEEQSNEAKIIDKIDMYIFVELFGKDLHFLDFIK